LIDVFILAGLYTLRIVAGGVASHHPVTLWLLAFSGFTFLSLALVKRCGELLGIQNYTDQHRPLGRGYSANDHRILETFGCASAFASSVVLALFVNSESAKQQYEAPEVLWLIVPLLLFWQCRLWLATARGYMHDDPIIYALKDWVSWLTAVCTVAIMLVATSTPRYWPALME
jgi:4-hydroxybenzoate polyprenyltransferase